jgi:DNA-3-methyladenine glycosylase II
MTEPSLKHLSRDPVMAKLAKKHGVPTWPHESADLLTDIIDSVISQQLSAKAATTIFNRFLDLLPVRKVDPEAVIALPDEKLRACGMSRAKASYVKGICQAVLDGNLQIDKLTAMSDDEVKEELVKLRGIGPWTAEMIMIFTLRRPDVFSVGDLGLRRAVANFYKVDPEDHAAIEKIAEAWKPYRTTASKLLWKSLGD